MISHRDHWCREGICGGYSWIHCTPCGLHRVEYRKAAPRVSSSQARIKHLPSTGRSQRGGLPRECLGRSTRLVRKLDPAIRSRPGSWGFDAPADAKKSSILCPGVPCPDFQQEQPTPAPPDRLGTGPAPPPGSRKITAESPLSEKMVTSPPPLTHHEMRR